MSGTVKPEQRTFTQEELDYWVEQRTEVLRAQLKKTEEALRVASFQAAVAEWAVAGVISRQLSMRVAVDLGHQQDAVDMARAVGARAGSELLHRAELAFQDHAEFSSLKMTCPPHTHYVHVSGRVETSPFYNWPRPYR